MEFDEMKKIWDSSSQQFYFGVNEEALHKLIVSKQGRAERTMSVTHFLMIGTNLVAGVAIVLATLPQGNSRLYVYLLGLWMTGCGIYLLIRRAVRARAMQRFDRTIAGDLDHAIDVASEQVLLSRFGRWNVVPVAIITMLAMWKGGQSIGFIAGFLSLLVVASWAAGWEHRVYERRRRELQVLKDRLLHEA